MTGKISLVLNAILLIAVIFLFTQINGKQDIKEEKIEDTSLELEEDRVYPSIAWVDNDSLTSKYKFLKDKSIDLKKLNNEISIVNTQIGNYESRYAKLVQKIQQFQGGAQNYTTEEALNKDVEELAFIESKVPELQTKLQTKYNALTSKQIAVNDSLARRVDRFLKSYSSDKPIDLILLYTQGVTGLYATDQLDLTQEVLEGLNSEYEAEKSK